MREVWNTNGRGARFDREYTHGGSWGCDGLICGIHGRLGCVLGSMWIGSDDGCRYLSPSLGGLERLCDIVPVVLAYLEM